jgi:exonuclease SbcD
MKIFHTGDWHLGKIINQVYMTQDQEYVLDQLITLMEAEKPDVLIIAGDIYDRAVPPVEAVELLDYTLNRILLELEIPVLLISGNHDSPDRLEFGSKILQTRGLYIAGRFSKKIQRVVLEDEHGPVNFYLLPYATPAVVKEVFQRDDIHDQDTAMQAIIANIQKYSWEPEQRNVLVTHGFVRGFIKPELSESEKPLAYTLSVGGADYIDVQRFKDFTYTALGHLHAPQTAGSKKVCYAGSILKYSFSEVNQKKAVTVVNIGADGCVEYEYKPLYPLRDVRRIKGQLKALLDPSVYQDTNVQDYLQVILTDEGELLEPMAKLRAIYPNVLALEFEISKQNSGEEKTSAGEGYKQKTKLELFRDFYGDITGKDFTEEKEAIVAEVIKEAEAEERGA